MVIEAMDAESKFSMYMKVPSNNGEENVNVCESPPLTFETTSPSTSSPSGIEAFHWLPPKWPVANPMIGASALEVALMVIPFRTPVAVVGVKLDHVAGESAACALVAATATSIQTMRFFMVLVLDVKCAMNQEPGLAGSLASPRLITHRGAPNDRGESCRLGIIGMKNRPPVAVVMSQTLVSGAQGRSTKCCGTSLGYCDLEA